MGKGRRTPDATKEIKGTDQPCRMNPNAPRPATGSIEPPVELEAAVGTWFRLIVGRLEAQQINYPSHAEKVWLVAERLADIEKAAAVITEHGGSYYRTNGGEWKTHPAVLRREKAIHDARIGLGELGLDPSNMSRTTKHDGKPPAEPTALERLMEEMGSDTGEEVPS